MKNCARPKIEASRRPGFLVQIRLSDLTTAFFLSREAAVSWLEKYLEIDAPCSGEGEKK